MKYLISKSCVALVLVLSTNLTLAHSGHGEGMLGLAGFVHPFTGLDHLLAMFAVGVWATNLGGRALWAVPLSFIAMMLGGGVLAFMDVNVPFIEQGIVMSVMVFGILLLAAKHLPLWCSLLLTASFAVCHGAAHGLEMPVTASAGSYTLGFVLATALIQAVGLGVGRWFQQQGMQRLNQVLGGVIAGTGMALAII
ncbi:HupE/UreJ family protein [Marinomonas sp. THO17]|uniref:HupE/UreJ family protein n=1 Tax=Marinomonas sp. THO17 TaxID=3149048 RepID=UPI00336BBE3D